MRRNVLHAILPVCGLIGALDLGYHLGRSAVLPTAEGQTAELEVTFTASSSQNEAFCFAFNKKTGQLVSYMQRQTGGLELKGIRNMSFDFNPKIEELPKSQSDTSVQKMKALAKP